MTPFFTGTNRGNYAVHGPAQYTRPELIGGGHGHVQITHAAGLLFHVTGLCPKWVSARMASHGLAVDLVDAMAVEFEGPAPFNQFVTGNVATGSAQFEGGVLGTVGGTGNLRGLTFLLQICCEAGWIDIDAHAGMVTIHRNQEQEAEIVRDEERKFPLSHLTARNLVDVILGQAPNCSPAEAGWRAVELLDAAYRSAGQHGQPISIEELYR